MRTNSAEFNEFNQAASKDLRLVIEIGFDDPLYLTSHSDIAGISETGGVTLGSGRQPAGRQPDGRQPDGRHTADPGTAAVAAGTVIEHVLEDVSSISQRLVPDEGRSEIGSMSFSVVDLGGAVTAHFRTEQAAGNGLKGRTVRLYRGGAGMNFTAFRLEQTQQISGPVKYENGAYQIQCADIQREMRADIFDLAKTYLAAELSAAETATLQVFDTSGFEPCTHVASFGDEPTGSFFYLKVKYSNGFEIIRATGKTPTTFTGLTRGVFGTDAVLHELPAEADADSGVEIEEYVYVELPAPAMAYALLTGTIIGGGTIPWNLGIDASLVDQPSFEDIGQDWFDSSDYAQGLIFRFQALEKTDGKRFIEREVCFLAGAFLKVGADGKLYMRRMTGIIGTADYVAELNADNAIAHGPITHDLSRLRNTFDIEWSWLDQPSEREPEFVRRSVLVDAVSIAIHGEADPLPLQFKGLHAERHTRTTLNNRFDALRDRYAGPPITLSVDLLPSMNDLEVGDIVRCVFPTIRDYSGTGTLDRAFEIQRIRVDQLSGRVTAELFGSTQKASPIADDGAGANAELPDGWYSSFGTEMTAAGLSIDGSGFLSADGSLTGGTTSRIAFYYLGDFTIPTGTTLTLTGNVQLHILGHYQCNGTLRVSTGQPANTPGYLGTTIGGAAITIRDGVVRKFPGPRRLGQHQAVPVIEIENRGGILAGMPGDMRGSGGAVGGDVWEWDGAAMVSQASGGAGGVGGGSLIIVSRGAGYGVSGETDLSGTDGATGGLYSGERAGSGGGGAPGCLLHVLDGSQVTVPVLSTHVVAAYGVSPINGADVDTQGKARADDPVDLGIAAARILYVPKSRDPYLDAFNDALDPSADVTFYYIKATNGTALHNGSGTLTVEAHRVTPAGDTLLSSGTIRLFVGTTEVTVGNGYAAGSDGFTGVFDAGDISGAVVVTLKDGSGGAALDTITLVDIADGVPAISGYIEPSNGLAWTRAKNAGAWTPGGLTTDLDCTFVQGGVEVARIARRVTLTEATGALAATTTSHAGGDLNTARVTVTVAGGGSKALTVVYEYSHEGLSDTVAETVKSVQSGDDATDTFYIKPVNGTAIHNGVGTLTVEARQLTPAGDTLLSTGTIKLFDPADNEITVANGYASGSDGYTGVFDAGDITDSIVVTLKDGVGGTPLDTITLVDVADGAAGGDGADAVYGFIEPSNGLAWTRAINSGSWTPAGLTSDLDCTFVQAGVVVARIARRLTLTSGNGTIAATTTTHKDGDLNTGRVTVTVTGGGSTAITVQFAYLFGSDEAKVAETAKSAQSGTDGEDPISGFLSNDSHVVSANADGTSYSLTGAGGTFNVFDGISDVTGSGPTYSVVGTATKNGLTMAINSTSGVYTLSGASWTSDGEVFTLRAVYGGATIDKTYTISKSKQGPSADGIVKLGTAYFDSQVGALPQSAGITFAANGEIQAYANGANNVIGKWWSNAPEAGVGDNYEVRLESTLSGIWDILAAAEGTWIALTADRTYRVLRTVMEGTGTDAASGNFEIRPVGGGSIEDETIGTVDAGD